MTKSSFKMGNVVKRAVTSPAEFLGFRLRNVAKLACFTVVAAVIMSGCGGGGKSGLKKNDYLGNLPALHADYELAKKADKEKLEKLMAKGKVNKFQSEAMKQEVAKKARKEKFEADKKAEMEKIVGKDIPFTCSEAFNKLNCEVASLKFCDIYGGLGMDISVVAKSDFVVDGKTNGDDYRSVYFRFAAKDGATIYKSSLSIFDYMSVYTKKSFTKGQSLQDGNSKVSFYVYDEPEKWVGFASIEFITKEEFNDIK